MESIDLRFKKRIVTDITRCYTDNFSQYSKILVLQPQGWGFSIQFWEWGLPYYKLLSRNPSINPNLIQYLHLGVLPQLQELGKGQTGFLSVVFTNTDVINGVLLNGAL